MYRNPFLMKMKHNQFGIMTRHLSKDESKNPKIIQTQDFNKGSYQMTIELTQKTQVETLKKNFYIEFFNTRFKCIKIPFTIRHLSNFTEFKQVTCQVNYDELFCFLTNSKNRVAK